MVTHHDSFKKLIYRFLSKKIMKNHEFSKFFADSESARHADSESVRNFFLFVNAFWSI